MLINNYQDNETYRAERRRLLEELLSYTEEQQVSEDLPISFDAYNLDGISKEELGKLLKYIGNVDADKPVIGSNIVIFTDDRARVENFARDLMVFLDSKGIRTGKIYSFKEKNVIADRAKEFCEAQGCVGDIVILGDIKDETDTDSGNKSMLSGRDTAWERIISELNRPSKTINIIFAPESIFKERFENKNTADTQFFYSSTLNFHITFGDMDEKDIISSVIEKVKAGGLTIGCKFESELKDYVQAVYGRSELKNEAFAKALYMRIVKEHYGSLDTKILGTESVPKYESRKSCEEAMQDINQLTGLKNVKELIREMAFLHETDCIDKSKMSLHMVFSGNAGTGKTTVAKMFAEIFYSMGLIKQNKLVEVSSADLVAQYVGHTAVKTKKICQSAYDGILFIDKVYDMAGYFKIVMSDTRSVLKIYRFIFSRIRFVRIINCDRQLGHSEWDINKSFFNGSLYN